MWIQFTFDVHQVYACKFNLFKQSSVKVLLWLNWLVPLRAYKLSLYFCLYHVLFSTKLERSAKQLLAADSSYCCLYPSKQSIDRFMFFACLYSVLFSNLEHSVEQVLTVDLSAHTAGTGRLLITMSMNNLKSPTNARITARL